ncbi:MAG: hypothetical protein LBC63_09350 [Holophagales bacterium]|jgi:cell wall-associated NlpC family hydrolase|nr:hypothetical protein [Holophagales bacterium]
MSDAVIQEALSWLGTPYHHAARVKGAGADCGQFPAAVFEAAGLIPPLDIDYYPCDWHLHRDDERYLSIVERHFSKVPIDLELTKNGGDLANSQLPLPGDIALFRYGRAISHGAIVIDWPIVIHAYIHAGAVVLDDALANTDLAGRFVGVWRLKK